MKLERTIINSFLSNELSFHNNLYRIAKDDHLDSPTTIEGIVKVTNKKLHRFPCIVVKIGSKRRSRIKIFLVPFTGWSRKRKKSRCHKWSTYFRYDQHVTTFSVSFWMFYEYFTVNCAEGLKTIFLLILLINTRLA